MGEEGYIQVGVTALRDPATREFLEPVPLYIKATPEAIASAESLTRDIGRLFAEKFREYKDGIRESAAT
jgi:hypothetical protein